LEDPDFYVVPEDNEIGYLLEVDLEIDEDLHEKFQDLPFCAESKCPPGSKQKKLLLSLDNKERYVIHYRALIQAREHGIKVKKIHRALQFNQSAWLKPYVDFNTERRTAATNEFERNFFKLLVNAIYGKTMENQRNHLDIRAVTYWDGRYGPESCIASPDFHSVVELAENFAVVQKRRTEIKIEKPIYIGLSILDISKTLKYDFHYSKMKEWVGPNLKLLYMDTDSFIYELKGVDVYSIMREHSEWFDTSNFAENNRFDIERKNQKVVGKFKNECAAEILTHFIGLRSKMYSLLIENQPPVMKAKGVKASAVRTITFQDYYNCLFNEEILKCNQVLIRSRKHNVCTEVQKKVALSPYDDKRFIIPGSTNTLPHGHKDIQQYLEKEELVEVEEGAAESENFQEREQLVEGAAESRNSREIEEIMEVEEGMLVQAAAESENFPEKEESESQNFGEKEEIEVQIEEPQPAEIIQSTIEPESRTPPEDILDINLDEYFLEDFWTPSKKPRYNCKYFFFEFSKIFDLY